MANPVIIAARLGKKRSSMEKLTDELNLLVARRDEFLGAIDDAETEEDINTIEEEVDSVQLDIDDKESQKTKLQKELDELESELEEANNKKPSPEDDKKENDKGERSMNKKDLVEVRNGLDAYIRSKGQTRDKFTTVEGGALVPDELMKPQLEEPYEELNLVPFVNVVKVNSGAGSMPVIKRATGKMTSVEELAENPELNIPSFNDVDYKIVTYRGEIPISQEMIDDADYDVVGLIADSIELQELNTKNDQISAALKTLPASAVVGSDGLKKMKNVDMKQVYNKNARWIVSASMFNELDTLKDNEGRYLLQPDIKAESGKSLFGKPVEILDDDVIGSNDGDLVGFYGNSKAAVTLFDRKKASVRWVDHHIYGQILAMFSRFQVKTTDTSAGFYFTYTRAVEGA